MAYPVVRVDELPNAASPATAKREVDEALDIETFGFNVYTVERGEQVPWGMHRHPRHEELFYVLEGTLTVETSEESLTVEAGEAIAIHAGQANRAHNAGTETVRLVAAGAPKETDEAVIEEWCPTCEERTTRRSERVDDGDTVALFCVGCGEETRRFSGG